MKYRKKPVEVEAMHFSTNNEVGSPIMDEIVNWINAGQTLTEKKRIAWHNGTDIFIQTLEGEMTATVGDWIIKGVKNEFYPVRNDIFLETYEPVEH